MFSNHQRFQLQLGGIHNQGKSESTLDEREWSYLKAQCNAKAWDIKELRRKGKEILEGKGKRQENLGINKVSINIAT